jgi:hypothetical protein
MLSRGEIEAMPDKDKFERRLQGKYWAKTYRLVIGRQPCAAVVDTAIKAGAQYLRKHLVHSLTEVHECLLQAVQSARFPSAFHGEAADRVHPSYFFDEFIKKLDQIVADRLDEDGVRLLALAAQDAFTELEMGEGSNCLADLDARFADHCIDRILENQFLGRVRDGVMEKTGRTPEQEREWEDSEFKKPLKERGRRMLVKVFRSKGKISIRVPRGSRTVIPTIEEQLHRPLVQM